MSFSPVSNTRLFLPPQVLHVVRICSPPSRATVFTTQRQHAMEDQRNHGESLARKETAVSIKIYKTATINYNFLK